jgi:predicted nucleic acid-binding protein
MFILDTNSLIYLSRGEAGVSDFLWQSLNQNQTFAISIITLVEFLSYPEITKAEQAFFFGLSGQMEFLDLDYRTAIEASELRKAYGLKLADSIIAAAALINNAILVTRDKDFKKIKEIEIINI